MKNSKNGIQEEIKSQGIVYQETARRIVNNLQQTAHMIQTNGNATLDWLQSLVTSLYSHDIVLVSF